MTFTDIYEQSSGVNLAEQQRLWDERGKGYYGEFLVFSEVFPLCSDKAKILTNVQIPFNGRTTEIDVLLIDSFGMISFEVKHYKGTIYGKAEDPNWTQYFKTTKNNVFRSPILQNDYHTAALHSRFPGVPVYSFIVFTSPNVLLRVVNNRRDVTVCHLNGLKGILQNQVFHQNLLTDETIDQIFTACSEWAPKKDNTITVDGKELPFSDYLQSCVETVRTEEKKKWETRKSPLSIVLTILGSVALAAGIGLLIFSLMQASNAQMSSIEAAASINEMSSQLSEMQEKIDKYFSKASWNNDGNLDIKEDFCTVSGFTMEVSKDLEKGTLLSFSVVCNGTNFGVQLNGNDELVLLLKDGRSVAGKLTDFTTSYIDNRFTGGKAYALPQLQIAGVDPDEIKYIKLIGLEIVKVPETYMIVAGSYEIAVFERDN